MGTITKALEMLNFFTRTQGEIGLAEFVRLTGRDKATVHRHLVELVQNGFLEQNTTTRGYRLGPAILRLSALREATQPVRSVLRPVIQKLATEVGELAHASLLQGEILSPVYHFDPAIHGTQVSFDESEMMPLHATSSGIAVLAFADPAFRDIFLSSDLSPIAQGTVTDPETLRALMEDVRATGSSRLSKGFDDEVSSQGVPIFDASGDAIGAISVAIPMIRATQEKLDAIQPVLCAAAVEATDALGGALPKTYPRPRPRLAG